MAEPDGLKAPVTAAVAGTFAVQTLAAVAMHCIPVFAPAAAIDYGIPETQVGLFTAIIFAGALSSGLVSGAFVARYGAMRVCQLAMVSAAIGLAFFTLALPWAAVISAVLIGFNYGPINPASSHVLFKVTNPKNRPFIFSLKQTGVPMGAGFAGLAVPALITLYDWQTATLILAGLALLTALAVQPIRAALDSDRRPGTVLFGGGTGIIAPVRMLLADPVIRRLSLIAFSYAGAQASIAAFLVVYLTVDTGFTLAQAGAAYAVSQAGAVAGRIFWGGIAGRVVPTRRVLAGQGILTGSCLLLTAAFATDWPLAAILPVCLVLGTSAYGWNALYLSEIASLAPPGQISAVTGGAQVFMFGAGIFYAPLFGGLAALTGDFTIPYLVIAGLTLAAGLYGFFLPRDTAISN